MAARILRRKKAAQDTEEVANYIAKDSLKSAVRFVENTESTLQRLAASSGIGGFFESVHPELANLRFYRIQGFPNHVISYIEHTEAIEVLRILHGARDLDAELGKS